jgi:hypothetical protein
MPARIVADLPLLPPRESRGENHVRELVLAISNLAEEAVN